MVVKNKTRSAVKKTARSSKISRTKKKPVKLDTEQQARLNAIRKWTIESQKMWDALSPGEQKEEHEGWKRAMNRMNEDRRRTGQRLLFLEPIE